jgi:isoquinoline 1-oxidoreductase beta subunit
VTHDLNLIPTIANFSRRGFLKGAAAGSFVLAVGLSRASFAEEPANLAREKKYGAESMPHGVRDDPTIFLSIAPDGTVVFQCIRQEMGQGVRTSLAMIIADELEADLARFKVVQADGDEERYGNQDTDGSRSVRHHFMPLRRAAAAARTMLEIAAATKWGVSPRDVHAENHQVIHPASGRKAGFGELTKAAGHLRVPPREGIKLKDTARFRYIGKDNVELVDGFDITTGRACYGIDTRLDGMLYAVVRHSPAWGDKVKSFDASAAMNVPGVVKVVPIETYPLPSEFWPIGGVGAVAKNTWAAIKGRAALKIEWEPGPNRDYNSDSYKKDLEAAARSPGNALRVAGDFDKAMAGAAKKVQAEYYVPHLAQAPMEPPAATVRIKDGMCEAWACVQAPQTTRDHLTKLLNLSPEKVAVHVTLLGGGFGRKSKPDFVLEAAILSRAMNGAPVKVTWTREDDVQHSYFHTVSLEHLEAGLDQEGNPTAWLHRSVAPPILATFKPGIDHESPTETGMGLLNNPLDLSNLRIENGKAVAKTRIGWFRSVSNIPHAFAIQSFVAELAAAAGKDQKAYLIEALGPDRKINPYECSDKWNYTEDPARYPIDTGRLRAVIERAALEAQWGRQLPKGQGLGIAAHYSFLTYVAAAVLVAISPQGEISIPHLDVAVDCGPQINPDRIRSQFEGAAIMGFGLTSLGEITFKNGEAEQTNFDTYLLARIDASPREIRVHLVGGQDWNQPLGGIGEPGVPPIAPAVCNAIFNATGKRIRSLPIKDKLRV